MAAVLQADAATARSVNGYAFEVPLSMGSDLLFPTPAGPAVLRVLESSASSGQSWRPSKLPLLGAVEAEIIAAFRKNTNDAGAGDGLSPFTTFELNLKSLLDKREAPLTRTNAVVLVFSVESANTPQPVAGVDACVP